MINRTIEDVQHSYTVEQINLAIRMLHAFDAYECFDEFQGVYVDLSDEELINKLFRDFMKEVSRQTGITCSDLRIIDQYM